MLYESLKLLWAFFHYRLECEDYAYLSLGFMGLNILWAATSIWGFKSINSKNSRYPVAKPATSPSSFGPS
jgi:hypothetical protein